MKKCLAVLLTATLLLTSLVIPGLAAGAETPHVIKQDFESWTTEDLITTQINASEVKAEIVEADGVIVKSGKALKFTSATGTTPANNTNWQKGVYFTDNNTKLKIGSTYKVSYLAYRVAANKLTQGDNGGLKICQYSSRFEGALYNEDVRKQAPFIYYVNMSAGQWVTVDYNIGSPTRVEYTFTATADYPLFVYYGKMNEEMYVDDITLTEVLPSTVTYYDGATKLKEVSGMPGTALSTFTPGKKSGQTFEGWYTDSAFTTKFTATTFPVANTALYAKYVSTAKTFGFDTPEEVLTVKSGIINKKSITTSLSTDTKKDGDGSLKVVSEADSNWVQLTKDEILKAGRRYRVTMDVLSPDVSFSLGVGSADNFWNFTSSGFPVPYRGQLNINKSADWKNYTFDFTAKEDGNVTLSTWVGYTMYIDNLTVTELEPVTVSFSDGEKLVDQLKGIPGSALTLPTAEKEGYTFEGWYSDSDFNNKYTATTFPSDSVTLYAKFTDLAIKEDYETSISDVSTSHAGKLPISHDTTTTYNNSSGSLKISIVAEQQVHDWIQLSKKQFKDNTYYRVTMAVKTAKGVKFKIGAAQTLYNVNRYDNVNSETKTIPASNDWQIVTFEFKTKDKDSNDNTKHLHLFATDFTKGDEIFIDNIRAEVITPKTALETALETNVGFVGTAVRPATTETSTYNNGKIAIRFKSAISENAIENGIVADGKTYTVEEYGHVYFSKTLLGDAELTVGTVNGTKAAKKAVAYSKAESKNIYFEKKNGNVYFTAALYGFTEAQFTNDYVARPYVILKNGEDTVTVYGSATQSSSLAEVADRAYYAQPGDIYDFAAAYTDTSGYTWSESYNVRKGLYDDVLSKLSNTNYFYLAPADAAQ